MMGDKSREVRTISVGQVLDFILSNSNHGRTLNREVTWSDLSFKDTTLAIV